MKKLMGLGNGSVRKSYYPELQKKIEELNREKNYISDIINSMPSSLIVVDNSGRITRWNRSAEKTFDIKEDRAIGMDLKELLPYLSEEADYIAGCGEHPMESRMVRKMREIDGNPLYEDVAIFPLTDREREGAVIRIDDVTEQVRLQETMVQSEKMLSVGGLAAGMAHEINNPLAGIVQTAGVLSKRITGMNIPANQKAAEKAGITLEGLKTYMEERSIYKMLSAISESGKRASAIIQNMLNFARRDDDSYSTHDPVRMLETIIGLASTDFNLKKQYDFRNITIVRRFEGDLSSIPCSESQIQQVILNLLRNGAEAMSEIDDPGYTPRFILKLQKEKDMLRLEIEDNGPGIPPEKQERIFDPFYTTKPAGIGTGLGLSVSYFIITENHKGSMEVQSEPGEGARFIIRLPMNR